MRLPTGNRRFGEDPLLKVGAAMMALALAFTVVAVAVTFVLRAQSERAVASETTQKSSVEPLVRSYPAAEPRVEEAKEPQPAPKPEVEPPKPEPEPVRELRPEPKPEPKPEREPLPVGDDDWPMPSKEELRAASRPRHYDLPPGAIMGLTVKAIGVYNAPVFDSDRRWALDNGVAHVPETSLPWSRTPQRNVYLAGHRLGWSGTGSRLVFYNLNKLRRGDEIVLKDRRGRRYEYRVSESFIVGPRNSWVMGQVVDRDMVTLQTCTPIPTFHKRLIVRAEQM